MTIVKHSLTIVEEDDRIVYSINPNKDELIGFDFNLIVRQYDAMGFDFSASKSIHECDIHFKCMAKAIMEWCVDELNTNDNIFVYSNNENDLLDMSSFGNMNYSNKYPKIYSYINYYTFHDYVRLNKEVKIICGMKIIPDYYIKPYKYKLFTWPFIPTDIADIIMKSKYRFVREDIIIQSPGYKVLDRDYNNLFNDNNRYLLQSQYRSKKWWDGNKRKVDINNDYDYWLNNKKYQKYFLLETVAQNNYE